MFDMLPTKDSREIVSLNTDTTILYADGSTDKNKRIFVGGIPTLDAAALELVKIKKDNPDLEFFYKSINETKAGNWTLDVDLKLEEVKNGE